MSTPYYAHGLTLPDLSLTQFTNVNVTYGLTPLIAYSSGDFAPSYTGSISGAPSLTIPTRQLASVVDLVNPSAAHGRGRLVSYNASAAASDLFYRQGEPYAVRYPLDQADAHEILRFTRAMLIWESISCSQGAPAEAAIQLLPTYDGINAPLTQLSGTITLLPDAAEQFTLGPIDVNGVRYDGLQRLDWRNNVRPDLIPHSGLPFNTYAGVQSYEPRCMAVVRNAQLHRAVGARGLPVTSLGVYFRKLKQSDITHTDAETVHIRITSILGTGYAQSLDNGGRVQIMFNVQRPSGASDPFAIDRDVAIPSV